MRYCELGKHSVEENMAHKLQKYRLKGGKEIVRYACRACTSKRIAKYRNGN